MITAPAKPIDPDELTPGTRLVNGRFEILFRLGRGGGATVYRALHTEARCEVALKIISSAQLSNHERTRNEQRFKNEMHVAAAMGTHPHIVRALDLGRVPELDNRVYMIQELVRGPSLVELICGSPMAPLRACRILRGVCVALKDLHGRGIVHRDVNPSNIVVATTEGIECGKLIDFGVAHVDRGRIPEVQADLTADHERPGTKHYMAPEQAMGYPPAPSFDVYALSVTFYEALVGDPPYITRSPAEVVQRKCDPTKPPFSLPKKLDLPPELVSLVDSGLARLPEDRIPSVSDFIHRLDPIIRDLESKAPKSAKPAKIVFANKNFKPAATAPGPSHETSAAAVAERSSKTARTYAAVAAAAIVTLGLLGIGVLQDGDGEQDIPDEATVEPSERLPEPSFGSQKKPETRRPAPSAESHPEPPQIVLPPRSEEQEAFSDSTPRLEEVDASGAHGTPPAPQRPRPKVQRKPSPDRDSPTATRTAKPPPPQTPACEALRESTTQASKRADWKEVLRGVQQAECWNSLSDRRSLQAQALFNLKRLEDCANLPQAGAPSAKRYISLCKQMLEQDPSR